MAGKKRKSSSRGKGRKKLTRRTYKLKLKEGTWQLLGGILAVLISVILAVSFTGGEGMLGSLNTWMLSFFGWTALFLPFVVLMIGLVLLGWKNMLTRPHVLLGSLLLIGSLAGLTGAGIIGDEIWRTISMVLTAPGAGVLLTGSVGISLVVLFNVSIDQLQLMAVKVGVALRKLLEKMIWVDEELAVSENGLDQKELTIKDASRESRESVSSSETLKVVEGEKHTETANTPKPALSQTGSASSPTSVPDKQAATRPWKLPPLSLLSDITDGEASRGDVKKNAQVIENTLESFGIDARVVEVNLGPSVTQYAIEVSLGTKLSKIMGLGSDLALALAAPTGQIRIEAPIPGRSLVGIEVPNMSQEVVGLKSLLSSEQMKKADSKTAVALGRDVSGNAKILDVMKMPHLLIAGATGSGKSACVNTIISSILFRARPNEVKFILVDPKRVELTQYNGIPHLLSPVIVDVDKVLSALHWAIATMTERYKQFAEVGARNIESYNKMMGYQAIPYIVIVIDELADIMMSSPREVETSIARLAQMARATGIHLIIATQRPSVDVITGLIKANIPARIAFAVSTAVDSKVIVDGSGAEKLLGKGDMLFIPPDQAKPMRIQGTFVKDEEINKMLAFIKNQGIEPEYTEEVVSMETGNGSGGGSSSGGDDRDDLFMESLRLIVDENKASASLIQRKLSVGYARAARILDQLEQAGVVGPAAGSKPRDIRTDVVNELIASEGA